jgi:hypothetical protein
MIPADLGTCTAIAAGEAYTVALRSDGNVKAWGRDYSGQTTVPPDLGTCTAIAAGGYHTTVAIRSDGTVRLWGAGNIGGDPPDFGTSTAVALGQLFTVVVQGTDTDGDGRPDSIDNCPAIANPLQADCNTNGIGDACELAAGVPDFNGDTIPDNCQCLADLFVDRQVNGADLGALLAFWGPANPALPSADINRDGNVNGADLGYLLNAWGACTN